MERIMIVDSDPNQMKSLKDALAADYLILGCSRGTNAMDLFEIFQPSALISDPNTHDLNGKVFVQKIRSTPFRPRILLLALSRVTSLRHSEESFAGGVDMIFSKPCSPDRIQKKLIQYFGQKNPKLGLEATFP